MESLEDRSKWIDFSGLQFLNLVLAASLACFQIYTLNNKAVKLTVSPLTDCIKVLVQKNQLKNDKSRSCLSSLKISID